ncbi:MAG: efflux RND transporter periplasmic adaptor subunit [Rickettsiales bacterium]
MASSQPTRFTPRRVLLIIVVLAIAGFLAHKYIPIFGGNADKKGGAVHVEAVQATMQPIEERIDAVGSLASNESVELRSEITGRISEIKFDDGQVVEQGDVLFQLDDSVQKADLARAEANLKLGNNNLQRSSKLSKQGFSSKVTFEEAEAELNLARANVQLAQANLDKTAIRAPFHGTVGIRRVSPGDYVAPGNLLANFDQIIPLKVEFTVPERYLDKLQKGTLLELRADTHPGKVFKATVRAIDSRVSSSSRSIMVQAITDNEERLLYPGQFVSINLPVTSKTTIVVPDQALIPLGVKNFVFLVVDGKAKRIEVQPGIRTKSQAEILSGIKEGDTVITAGQQKLQDGVPVTVSAPTPVVVTPPEEEQQPKDE